MPKYYDNWRESEHLCRHCGWHGLGNELVHGEMFDALFEVDCPQCGERVTTVELPTLTESRANWEKVAPVDRAIVEVAEAQIREQERSKPKGRFRMPVAWLLGLFALLATALAIGFLGDSVGLPPVISLDTPLSLTTLDGDYIETYSLTTSIGLAAAVFSTVVAIWVGRAFYFSSVNAGFSPLGRLTYLAWLMATAILVCAGAVIDLAMRSIYGAYTGYFQFVLQATISAGVAWACYQWWKNRAPNCARR